MRLLPGFALIALTLVAALPWPGRADVAFGPSFLPIAWVYYWSVRQPRLMPAVLVFLSGIVLDVLTFGPLGYWSLVGLAGQGLAMVDRRVSGETFGWAGFATFGVAMTLLAVFAWGIASVYGQHVVDWRPLVSVPIWAMGLYIVTASVQWLVAGSEQRRLFDAER